MQGVIIYGFHPVARWKYRHIPGPPVRWLVGAFPEIARYGLEHVYKMYGSHYGKGGAFKLFLGARPHIIITDAVLAHRASNRSAHKYEIPILRHSKEEREELDLVMFLASGDSWKVRHAFVSVQKT